METTKPTFFCKSIPAPGAVYVNVTHYLSWIHRAKLQDLIEDYKSTKNLPYDRMDSSVFGAIFEYLSKEDNIIWNWIIHNMLCKKIAYFSDIKILSVK